MPTIGIDLGTTYCCLAVMRNGTPDIVANDQGNRITPSYVAFTNERMIGETAVHQISRNAQNTVYDAKRLIGRWFNDSSVQADMEQWGFKVIEYEKKPKIQVEYKKEKKTFSPEEISGMVLERMKSMAEEYVREKVHSAVITVPAYFTVAQRRATKDAAQFAGLHVLGILNEPTAAALAYGLQRKSDEKRKVLIFDLGGGTFDVTVLTIEEEIFNVISTGGDTHLGGQDFTNRLLNHFVKFISSEHDFDISKNFRAKSKLRAQCEKAKRLLSAKERTTIVVDSLIDGEDFESDIIRARFELLNEDLFLSTMDTVEQTLRDAEFSKDEIDDVVLVGGSTRIPAIRKQLEKYFGADKICKTINPDEAVAYGAAVHAANLSGDTSCEMNRISLSDVTPLSLGIEVRGEVMSVVIKRNTKIPTQKWDTFQTTTDNQKTVEFKIYEGERTLTKLNNFLGSFELCDIPRMPKGEAKLSVCFNIDSNGVLGVTACCEDDTENFNSLTINPKDGRLTDAQMKEMLAEAERFRKDDRELRAKLSALSDLQNYTNDLMKLESNGSSSESELKNKCNEIIQWIEGNRDANKEQFAQKKEELEKVYNVTQLKD